MNDIVGLSGFLAVGVSVVLLAVAVTVARRSARLQETEQAAQGPLQVVFPPAPRATTPELTTEPVPFARAATTAPEASPQPAATPSPVATSTRPTEVPVQREIDALVIGTVLAVIAVYLAAWQWESTTDLVPFWALLLVGAAFTVVARRGLGWFETPGGGQDAEGTSTSTWLSVRYDVWRAPGVQFVGAAVLAEAGSLLLFGIERGLSLAWLLHLVAVGLFAAGLWRSFDRSERSLIPGWTRTDTVLVGVMILAGLLARIWRLGSVPEGLWFDESQRGLEALRMLAERGYRPIFAAGILQEPTGLWYLMMPMISMLGRDAVALRLPVALAGTLGVGAVYLLGRVLYGRRVAIIAAGLAVAMTWHLNFSRIALPAAVSLTFDTLAAVLFLVGLRRQSRFLLGAAGLVCGAGLYFYFTSQLMPFVLGALGLHQAIVRRFRLPRRLLAGLVLCAFGYALAAGPFVFYAVTSPAKFAARANAVTVMRDVENAHSWAPVLANARAHLLMFNVAGDNNGRHNWSGHPMLDPVTGGLAVLGFGLALSRAWRPEQILLLVWIPVALFGGIFSSIWDAPQSHRSIDAIIPAVLLAALPLGLLWQVADRAIVGPRIRLPGRLRVGRSRLIVAGLVVTLLVVTDASNLDRFFQMQQQSEKTWTDFMAPQTAAGRQAASLPANVRIYVEPNWFGHPSVRFVDAGAHEYVELDPGAHLPVTVDSAAIFIAERPGLADRIAALYPAAARTFTRIPENGRTAGYGFILPPEVVRSTRGIEARYQGPAGTVERREPTLSTNWPEGAPMAAPFSAAWTATLTVPTWQPYRLRLEGPPSLVLTLDGTDTVKGGAETTVRLARGNHQLRVAGNELGSRPIRVLWAAPNEELRPIPANLLNSAPVETNGLVGRVFAGPQPAGEPLAEQIDPNVELKVHLLPTQRPYTLEWSGAIRAERDGQYRFSLSSLGASGIWLDGSQVTRKEVPEGIAESVVDLRRGWHDVKIRFVDTVDFSYVTAFWQPPGADREPIPPSALRPWPADRVQTARLEDAHLP